MLQYYLKVAFRNMNRYRSQNIIGIIGLSVSIACFALCFYIVRSLTGMNTEYPDADRMYLLSDSVRNRPSHRHDVGAYLARDYPDIEKYVTMEFYESMMFETGDEKRQKFMLYMMDVNPPFFDFFSMGFIGGTLSGYETMPNGIVLNESCAMRLFGRLDVVGETLVTKRQSPKDYSVNYYTYTICGVIRDFGRNSYFNMTENCGIIDGIFLNDEQGSSYPPFTRTVIMLHKGVNADDFNRKLTGYAKKIDDGIHSYGDTSYYLLPFSQALKTRWGSTFYAYVGIFGGIGLLVLLVSMFNYTSYTVTIFMNRRHECAIRKTSNAGYGHLFLLFFTETAVAVILSGLMALLWVPFMMPLFNDLFGNKLGFDVSTTQMFAIDASAITTQVAQYTVAALMLAFLLIAVPVRRINGSVVRDMLYGGKSRNPKSQTRNVLLGFQLFIAVIFISATVFVSLQLRHVASLTISTLTQQEKENIIELNLNNRLRPYVNDIMERLKSNPAIEDILRTDFPLAAGLTSTITYGDKQFGYGSLNTLEVGSNYAEFTKTKILEGRFFEDGRDEAVVNLRAKKLLGNEHVIGETVTDILGRRLTIVGVTEDVVVADAADELKAAFFMPVDRLGLLRYIYAKVNPVNRKAAEAYILQIIREYLPATIDYKLSSLSEIISKTRQTENTLLGLISLFAVITAVISLSGVYSSVVLATGRRRKEVAIRKINGATLGSIIRLFLRTYVGILFVAAIPAFALVYFAAVKWLESYAYRISISFSTFAVIFAALNGLLILTVIYQLIKTARLNPAETVKRSE